MSLFAFEGSSKITVKWPKSSPAVEKLKKLFPLSFVDGVPETYEVPERYLDIEFWKQLSGKLNGWWRNWQKIRLRIQRDVQETLQNQQRHDQALNMLEIFMDNFEAVLTVCWNGDTTTPPLPLEIFKNIWNELKEINHEICEVCEKLDYKILFAPFSWSKHVGNAVLQFCYSSDEKYESLKKQLESFCDDGPLYSYIAKNILSLCTYIYKIAKDVDVEEQEDTLPILIGLLTKYRKNLTANSYIEIREAVENLDEECSNIRVSGTEYVYQYLPATLEELREIVATGGKDTFVRRSLREKKSVKLEMDEEEVKTMKKTKIKEEIDEKKGRGRPRRESKPVKIYTPPHDIDETGQEEEDDLMEEIVLIQSPRQLKRKLSVDKNSREPVSKVRKVDVTIENVTQKDVMIGNEKIFLETTRLHLLLLKYPDGRYARSFIPAIFDSIDRALSALGELAMVDYIMHKSAVEVGVCQLIKDLRNQSRTTNDIVNFSSDKIARRCVSMKSEAADFEDEPFRELELAQL